MDYTSGLTRTAYQELPRLAHLAAAARQDPQAYAGYNLAIRAIDGRVVEVFVGPRGGLKTRLYRGPR